MQEGEELPAQQIMMEIYSEEKGEPLFSLGAVAFRGVIDLLGTWTLLIPPLVTKKQTVKMVRLLPGS